MDDRRSRERHVEEVLLRVLDPLLHGETRFLGLAVTEADATLAVADDHQGGEGETPTALDHLGDAVHPDRPLLVLGLRHSELQSRLSSGLGEGRDAAVVPGAAAVEDDLADPVFAGAFRHDATDLCGGRDVARGPGSQAPLQRRGGDDRAPGGVVDHLGDDVAVRAEDREPRPLRRSDHLAAQPFVPPAAQDVGALGVRHRYFPAFPALCGTNSPAYVGECGNQQVKAGSGQDQPRVQDSAVGVARRKVARWIAVSLAPGFADERRLGADQSAIASQIQSLIRAIAGVGALDGRVLGPGDRKDGLGIGGGLDHPRRFYDSPVVVSRDLRLVRSRWLTFQL